MRRTASNLRSAVSHRVLICRRSYCTKGDTWMRPLANGDLALVLWNRGTCGAHRQMSASWGALGLPPSQPMAVRDLFARKDIGTATGQVSGWVNPDGVLMLRLSRAS